MRDIRQSMERYGVPGRDLYDLPSSPLTFADGAHYRPEISGIERLSTLEAMLDEAQKRGLFIPRVIATVAGSTLLDRAELRAFAQLAHDAGIEVIVTPGPKASWDTGRQAATPEGKFSGGRMRGSDNVYYLLADIQRCIDLGFRGFLIWDEGVLYLLRRMRDEGEIPREVVFKVSVFAGHANPAGAQVLEMLGASTFNPVADLSRPMLAAIRRAVHLPMDVYVYIFDSFGGFNRFWEAAEIARVASPCYFKIEPGESDAGLYNSWVSPDFHAFYAREKVRYAEIINELVAAQNPALHTSAASAPDLAVPQP